MSQLEPTATPLTADDPEKVLARVMPKFAHDIKKPFSQMTMAMELLGGVHDLARLQKVMDTVRPGIERETATAQLMVNDLSILAGAMPPHIQTSTVEDLVASLKRATTPLFKALRVNVSWQEEFTHEARIRVDLGLMTHACVAVLLTHIPQTAEPLNIRIATAEESDKTSLRFSVENGTGGVIAFPSTALAGFYAGEARDWSPIRMAAAGRILREHEGCITADGGAVCVTLPTTW